MLHRKNWLFCVDSIGFHSLPSFIHPVPIDLLAKGDSSLSLQVTTIASAAVQCLCLGLGQLSSLRLCSLSADAIYYSVQSSLRNAWTLSMGMSPNRSIMRCSKFVFDCFSSDRKKQKLVESAKDLHELHGDYWCSGRFDCGRMMCRAYGISCCTPPRFNYFWIDATNQSSVRTFDTIFHSACSVQWRAMASLEIRVERAVFCLSSRKMHLSFQSICE